MINIKTGTRFGNLIVLGRAGTSSHGEATWTCLCDCGNTCVKQGYGLRIGQTTHCGCLTGTHISESANRGLGGNATLRYMWTNMKTRCKNPNYGLYHRYGGRGICVCKEWDESFGTFMSWAIKNGWKSGLSIERIDNDKGYNPDNCRFATAIEQANNRRTSKFISVFGRKETLSMTARRYKISYSRLQRFIAAGNEPEMAVKKLLSEGI